MRKKILILMIIVLFMCGCSIQKLDVDNYDQIIEKVLLQNYKLKNNVFNGYSYYIPHGVNFINKDEDNALLIDKYKNYYYVYVDVISYYNKIESDYKEDKESYYSKKIVSKNKKNSGYLEINKIKNKYFVEAMYNYVKIEVYTSKDSLDDVVLNVCGMLSSVRYNDRILATTIGDKVLNYKEESFNIFTTKKSNTNYLDYIERYDSGAVNEKDEKKTVDEDIIDITIEDD